MTADPKKTGSRGKGDDMDLNNKWKKIQKLDPEQAEQLSWILVNKLENSLEDLERKLVMKKVEVAE